MSARGHERYKKRKQFFKEENDLKGLPDTFNTETFQTYNKRTLNLYRVREKDKEIGNPSISPKRLEIRGYYRGGGLYDPIKTEALQNKHTFEPGVY